MLILVFQMQGFDFFCWQFSHLYFICPKSIDIFHLKITSELELKLMNLNPIIFLFLIFGSFVPVLNRGRLHAISTTYMLLYGRPFGCSHVSQASLSLSWRNYASVSTFYNLYTATGYPRPRELEPHAIPMDVESYKAEIFAAFNSKQRLVLARS